MRNRSGNIIDYGSVALHAHLRITHAVTYLSSEIYRLTRNPDGTISSTLAAGLQQAADTIAREIVSGREKGFGRRSSRQVAVIQGALADIEARLMVAGSLGHLSEQQQMALEPILRYVGDYCLSQSKQAPQSQYMVRLNS